MSLGVDAAQDDVINNKVHLYLRIYCFSNSIFLSKEHFRAHDFSWQLGTPIFTFCSFVGLSHSSNFPLLFLAMWIHKHNIDGIVINNYNWRTVVLSINTAKVYRFYWVKHTNQVNFRVKYKSEENKNNGFSKIKYLNQMLY